MGWANCGEDSKGRPIGYAHEATCDHEGCEEKIDRGLAYKCGDMHGEGTYHCEGYFCYKHRRHIMPEEEKPRGLFVCFSCEAAWREADPEGARAFDEE